MDGWMIWYVRAILENHDDDLQHESEELEISTTLKDQQPQGLGGSFSESRNVFKSVWRSVGAARPLARSELTW